MPIVLIEISPATSPPTLARALADACSSAVRDGTCELSADPTTEPDAVAIVRWDDAEERHARVQVGQRRTGDPDWQTKELVFGEADSRVERWRSVGLTIATLAGATTPAPAPTSDETHEDVSVPPPKTEPAVPPPAPTPVEPQSAPTIDVPADRDTRKSQTPSPGVWVGVGASAGTGLDPGGPRFGGSANVGWRPSVVPLFVRGAVGFAVRPSNSLGLSAQWETLTLAAGAILERGPFALEPWLGGGLSHIRAAVVDPTSRRSDAGTQSTWTIDAGADGIFRTGQIGFVLGLATWRAGASTGVVLKDRQVATDGTTGWSGTVGARFFVP